MVSVMVFTVSWFLRFRGFPGYGFHGYGFHGFMVFFTVFMISHFIGSPAIMALFPTAGFSHRVYCRGFNEAIGTYMSFF